MGFDLFGRNKTDTDPEEETPEEGMEQVVGLEEPSEAPPVQPDELLQYFSRYPKYRLREEFQELGKMVIDPAPLLGIADGTDVAQIVNLLYVQRLHYMAVPECLKGDSYMVFDLFVATAKPMVNLAKNGRLLQAITGQRIEGDLPDWLVAYSLRKKELEMAQAHAKEGGVI